MNYYRPKKHHYFRNTAIVVLLLAIGAGGAYYYYQSDGNQAVQHTSHRVNQDQNNQQNSSSQRPNNNNNQAQQVNHKSAVHKPINKVKQPVNRPGYTFGDLPKSIQGTWYTYDNGKLQTMIITNNKITINGDSTTIHARQKNVDSMKASKHPNWSIAISTKPVRGQRFTQILGWNQSAGDGEGYALLNVNGMSVLEAVGGAYSLTDANYYKTPQQAKQNKKKIYKSNGERRYTTNLK